MQSNYIPWKGYLDLLNAADMFVIYDEVQFTRRDWRNRNKIVLDGETKWLTIPVDSKGSYLQPINDIKVSDPRWAEKHWASIKHAYGKAPFFKEYRDHLDSIYEAAEDFTLLTEVNELFLRELASLLDIKTEISRSDRVERQATAPAERLIEICLAHGATTYLSGPAAKSYIDPELFERAGLRLAYADYSNYPVYDQRSDAFEHGVSIIDLLMRVGPEAASHLKSAKSSAGLME